MLQSSMLIRLPYPSVSDFAGGNSDHGPSKTQTKTQATPDTVQSAPKERRRRRAGKWSSKRVFLESPFLLCPSKVCPEHLQSFCGKRRNGLSKTPFWTTISPHDTFSAPLAHPRHCVYGGKEKLRPWSKFLERENSDHGLRLGCFRSRGRRGGSQKWGGVWILNPNPPRFVA